MPALWSPSKGVTVAAHPAVTASAGSANHIPRWVRLTGTAGTPGFRMKVSALKIPVTSSTPLPIALVFSAPFVPAWYQGDLKTNAIGRGVLDVTGIFSAETFILNPGVPAVPVNLTHLGIWFADPADAVTAGCPGTVTPFDGDHNAGIQVLHTVPAVGPLGPLARIK